ncbi:MAG TPA: response regulator transcription factor [Steroidobacteraceae bacterium]|nr:response regulator transcription factor [Steroidobacteraceae bacterium]
MIQQSALSKSSFRVPPRQSGSRPHAGQAARRGGRIRILLVGESGIMRSALCALLEAGQEFSVIGTASSALEASDSGSGSPAPQIILGDFPAMVRGMEIMAELKARFPDARTVVLTFEDDDRVIDAALQSGAAGYVLKSAGCTDLFTALRSIAAGQRFTRPVTGPDTLASAPLASPKPAGALDEHTRELTDREREVIRLIAAGHRTREIATILSLSHKTIEKHRASLMRKLGLRNASAVAAYAIAHGLG